MYGRRRLLLLLDTLGLEAMTLQCVEELATRFRFAGMRVDARRCGVRAGESAMTYQSNVVSLQ